MPENHKTHTDKEKPMAEGPILSPTHQAIGLAIATAAKKIPSLIKGERNAHGNYNYVGIDDFFDKVAKVAYEQGIAWSIRQTSFEIMPQIGKTGIIVASFAFDLVYTATGGVWTDFFTITIPHPIQGAQTSGSALSYAMKMFLRNTFGVVTGEQDADASDPADMLAPSAAKSSSSPAGQLPPPVGQTNNAPMTDLPAPEVIFNMMTGFLSAAKSEDDLKQYWHDNQKLIEQLRRESPGTHKKLVSAFAARKTEIQKETTPNAV